MRHRGVLPGQMAGRRGVGIRTEPGASIGPVAGRRATELEPRPIPAGEGSTTARTCQGPPKNFFRREPRQPPPKTRSRPEKFFRLSHTLTLDRPGRLCFEIPAESGSGVPNSAAGGRQKGTNHGFFRVRKVTFSACFGPFREPEQIFYFFRPFSQLPDTVCTYIRLCMPLSETFCDQNPAWENVFNGLRVICARVMPVFPGPSYCTKPGLFFRHLSVRIYLDIYSNIWYSIIVPGNKTPGRKGKNGLA